MSLHSLPLFVRLAGRPVILVGTGEAAEAKRRLLERAGALIVGEDSDAPLAIVVDDEDAVARLKARGVLVNAVDRPELCDFTLPAIVERGDVLVAVGTGGVSAGLAAALRQRFEALLPARLGDLARALHRARGTLRDRFPDGGARRRAIGAALAPGGPLDPLGPSPSVDAWLALQDRTDEGRVERITIASADPDQLTLAQARLLALADRLYAAPDVPLAILARARADAERCGDTLPDDAMPGLSIVVEMS